ncbi:hypothetical protein [Pedobacter metabolipauper]|uniref:Endosialidase-like protein n=1 Tax=Pedobacter metabolipauper TaxID=425513 RepID=A0A4R6T215_9SPHI|nr:hypothetical protein [Pedobacter metabolipauper]TDQ11560.1 hypothetical protein ATK78_0683 [Pedobacter metabolipauper]
MKQILLLMNLVLLCSTGYSQNSIPLNAGNVGIGTTSPQGVLHVSGPGIFLDAPYILSGTGLIIAANTGSRSSTSGAQIEFAIPANTDGTNSWGQARIITVAGSNINANATGKMILGTRRHYDKLGTGKQWYYGEDIVIDGNGFVGIGTLNPQEALSVNGKIRAHEIKVETANWPDYVFANDYQLPSLLEIEKHIKQNGHLPGIPSAEEIKTNGVDLGDMNAKLLKKIEELTLYIISLEKRVKSIESKEVTSGN